MRIFWGLLLIVVDIKLNNFDLLLPDPLGYILIFTALRSLEQFHPRFRAARPYATSMVVVSSLEMLHIDPLSLVSILAIVLDFLMIWHVCTGIIELALRTGNLSLSQAATNRRNLCFVLATTHLLVAALFVVAPVAVPAIAIPLVIVSLTVGILVILLMRRAALEIG
jgi:succinate dehydrogenase/fumarate reductase cytochrome b subunit